MSRRSLARLLLHSGKNDRERMTGKEYRKCFKDRAILSKAVREFFSNRDYIELDTPVLSPSCIPESTIHLFSTHFFHPFKGKKELFLLPSPELWIKRLIGEGIGNCFQLGKCFRNGESQGKLHNPEFTMLEWYSMEANYMDSLELTLELLQWVGRSFPEVQFYPVHIIPIKEIVYDNTGIDLEKMTRRQDISEAAASIGIETTSSDTWESMFHKLFLEKVEPAIPQHGAVFLKDYPVFINSLAKAIPNTIWGERWELYLGRMEIANCYTEEKDPQKIRLFFEKEHHIREKEGFSCTPDWSFPDLFSPEYPHCSGVALGFDRLLMYCTGIKDIRRVFPFSWDLEGKP